MNCFKWFSKLNTLLSKRLENSDSLMKIFASFSIVNFIVFYILWNLISKQESDNLGLRLIAVVVCGILLLKDYWPKSLKVYIPLYWYSTIFYCLPFFGTYMFLYNKGLGAWSSNIILGLFWLVLITDWASFAVLLPLGIGCGWIFYHCMDGSYNLNFQELYSPFTNYIWSVVIALIFAHRKEKIQRIKALGATIGHELYTPLRAMNAGISGLNDYIKILTDGYIQARKAHLPVEEIHPKHLQKIPTLLQTVEQESEHAFNILDMMLVKLKDTPSPENLEECSALVCIETALKRYPFIGNDRELITVDPTHDFTFQGKELLIVHVLFNLMKNALHYIKKAKKGKIHIWMTVKGKTNTLHFKDTGTGIHQKDLPHIFEEFYSRTNHGTGIGLAFCKNVMLSIDGNITCQSVYGEYSVFSLYFPRKDEKPVECAPYS